MDQETRLQDHSDCTALTALTLDQLPSDGSLGKTRKYRRGEFIWDSATKVHHLYFLKRGQVAITLAKGSTCDVITRVIKPGEPFGELCYCSRRDQPRVDCAQAAVDSQVIEISFEEFLAYLRRSTGALQAFAFTCCKRLAEAGKRLEVLSHRGATPRLGRLLLQLAADGRNSAKIAGAVTLAMGHDELARMAAMTRSHVTVTMNKFRRLGLVHYDRGSPLTIEVTRLEEHLARDAGEQPL